MDKSSKKTARKPRRKTQKVVFNLKQNKVKKYVAKPVQVEVEKSKPKFKIQEIPDFDLSKLF